MADPGSATHVKVMADMEPEEGHTIAGDWMDRLHSKMNYRHRFEVLECPEPERVIAIHRGRPAA